MVVINEFRIPLPYTLEEYRIGQLYSVATMSREESGGGDGIEIVKNEPFENEMGKGQYTLKIYHIAKKVPSWVQKIIPCQMLDFYEEAWNAFPYCKTKVTCPFMGDKFSINITTMHLQDRGETENVHNLNDSDLKKRKVKLIDISNTPVDKYKKEDDPKLYNPTKIDRGTLDKPDWIKTCPVVMTAYKLVEVKCAIFGIQNKVESKIVEIQGGIFTNLHRRLFCRTDDWIHLTIQDIRAIEDKVQKELAEMFAEKPKAKSGKGKKKATPGAIMQQRPTPKVSTTTTTTTTADDPSSNSPGGLASNIDLSDLENALNEEEEEENKNQENSTPTSA